MGRHPPHPRRSARSSHPAHAARAAPVLDACPSTRTWTDARRPIEVDVAGARDRALLLVGFVAALRRGELVALTVDQLAEHPNGLVLTLARSKTNQTGEQTELVVLARAGNPQRCPVTLLQRWLELAGIASGPLFRRVTKGNRVGPAALDAGSVTRIVQSAVARVGLAPQRYSGHSLRTTPPPS